MARSPRPDSRAIQNIVKSHAFEAVPEDHKGPGKLRRSATPGAWREGLTPEDQEVAQEIMGGGLCEARLRDVSSDIASRPTRATAGLPFDHEDLEWKLVWIWGSPRTGSTWLLEMLCNPLESKRSERLGFSWHEGFTGPVPALAVDEFLISSHLAPHQGGLVDIFGAPYPATLTGLFARRSSYAFSSEFEDVWRPEARRFTLVRLHAIVERARAVGLEVPDLPLLVIKEVNGSHAADLVMSLFPRSKMIFMLRDGRDMVADSLLDANSKGGWLTSTGHGKGGFDTDEERLEVGARDLPQLGREINVCEQAYGRHASGAAAEDPLRAGPGWPTPKRSLAPTDRVARPSS